MIRLRLNTVISLGGFVLAVPTLAFALTFGYLRNSHSNLIILDQSIKRAQNSSIDSIESFFAEASSVMRVVASAAAMQPKLFKTEESKQILYSSLIAVKQIDAIYVSFEDGYHRVVTRITENRRISDNQIPPKAQWHSSYIDEFSTGNKRSRHRQFYDTWPQLIGGYSIKTQANITTLDHYVNAKKYRQLSISEPSINPDTGYPVVSLGMPIISNGKFIGFVGSNLTLNNLSSFLVENKISKRSITLIAKENGEIIAQPYDIKNQQSKDQKKSTFLQGNKNPLIRESFEKYEQGAGNDFRFRASNGMELTVSFVDIPDKFDQNWKLVFIAPTEDFIGHLRRTKYIIAITIAFLLLLLLLLIRVLSRGLAKNVEDVTQKLQKIQSLESSDFKIRQSKVKEIFDLQSGLALAQAVLQSFTKYVPLGVIKDLLRSGQEIVPGLQRREMTIFFVDIEDFSTYAEKTVPEDLIEQMEEFFTMVCDIVRQENGTVDKFIGDNVMAFWGAPSLDSDHAFRACCAALRTLKGMENLNRSWETRGKSTMQIRIGLNSANVLVGNIGSVDRINYTVMGNGVNIAARLEAKNKDFNTRICISDSVYLPLSNRIIARLISRITVKGRKERFPVYELLGIVNTTEQELMHKG